jgi:hypothetical protein
MNTTDKIIYLNRQFLEFYSFVKNRVLPCNNSAFSLFMNNRRK